MSFPEINHCPGTLAEGFDTYSRAHLNRMFMGKKVHHILPYESPASNQETDDLFDENRKRISISGEVLCADRKKQVKTGQGG